MTTNRKRLLVFGHASTTLPHVMQLAKDELDVVRASEVHMPDCVADYVFVDGSEPQQISDVQIGALGVFHALPDGVVLLDESLTILWHNQTFRQIIKADVSEVLTGRSLQDVIAPGDGTDISRVALPTGAGEAASISVRREDRSVLALRLAKTPIDLGDGNHSAVILTVRDVTAHRDSDGA